MLVQVQGGLLQPFDPSMAPGPTPPPVHGESHWLPPQVVWWKEPKDVQHMDVVSVVVSAASGIRLDSHKFYLDR